MTPDPLGQFVRSYIDRVVNERDLSAVDDMVSPDYRGSGSGFAPDIDRLREFYQWQARWRPDWHIDVQETIEVGEWVAVRAYAGGTVSHDEDGAPLASPYRKTVEWLAVYRVRDGHIVAIQLIFAIAALTP